MKRKSIKDVTVKPHHPLMELLAKKMFGIENPNLPISYKRRMVNEACKAVVKWHEENKGRA